MFIYKNIKEEIFSNVNNKYNTLKIITGYITPSYIKEISGSFNGNIDIYLGMGDSKFKKSVYDSIKAILNEENNRALNVYYTDFDVHAKIYYWENNSERKILFGSANFSESITNNYKEVLGDYYSDDINMYINYIVNHSTNIFNVPDDKIKNKISKYSYQPHSEAILIGECGALLPLLSSRATSSPNILGKVSSKYGVHASSGLNWGLCNKSPNKLNDVSIPIPMALLKNDESMLRIPKASNRVYDVVWDDGETMKIQFEGNNPIGVEIYPKQIASYPSKDILGKYLRKRIGTELSLNLVFPDNITKDKVRENPNKYEPYMITEKMLRRYGRFDIEITDMGDGRYYFNFSNK